MDVIGSLTFLAVLSPLFLLIALLVKSRSRGSVIFRQVRSGQANGQLHEPGNNGLFKLANDPRVTPVGRMLRKTSLDELPQLWNVPRGDMSLVGPRPPLPYEIEQYQPWQRRRVLEAKPELTGPWQVAGRSRTTFDEMVRLDLRYARTRSLWTDMKILLATPAAVVSVNRPPSPRPGGSRHRRTISRSRQVQTNGSFPCHPGQA